MEEQPALSVHLVRYDVRRWNAARSLAPVASVALIAARRFPNRWLLALAFALLAASLLLFVRARKGFSKTSLTLGRHTIQVSGTDLELSRQTIHRWTLLGSVARLYGSRFSYKLRMEAHERELLAAALQRVLGRATPLKRRGSVRARIIAACVCVAGLSCFAAAIALNLVQLVFIAVPAAIVGFATYMALSQRIAA